MGSLVHAPAGRLHAQLAGSGFTRARPGDELRCNGTAFRFESGWSALRSAHPDDAADPLVGQLGQPGLWKWARDGNGAGFVRVFDLPPLALGRDGADAEDEGSPLSACLEWALATAHGRLPDGWGPPPRAEVDGWAPPAALTVQAGPLVRQATVAHGPGRLALTCPLLTRVPEALPPARRAWLRELLLDGQDRWRMVRLGLSGEPHAPAVLAEVDLSGCPPEVAECLFGAGLAALRWVVEWLARPIDFLADAARPSRALEVFPARAEAPAERS
jgi:hypothetical protein